MPDPRCPYASWNPGVQAGYRAGRTSMQTAVAHTTVGRNSTPIGLQGYFHFLVARNGTVQQFCEVDAVAWHAGDPWNSRGPGIEVEYLDEPTVFTDVQRDATQAVCHWLSAEWGIPLAYYDGARRTEWGGFISHRSLIQTGDQHNDFWPAEDAALIFGDDMPLSLSDFDGIHKVVGGDPNLDGTVPTLSQLVGDVAALRREVAAAGGVASANVALLPSDLEAIATKVADKLAARLKD